MGLFRTPQEKAKKIDEQIAILDKELSKFREKFREAEPNSSLYKRLLNKIEKLNKEIDRLKHKKYRFLRE